jgi:hypothetical protein
MPRKFIVLLEQISSDEKNIITLDICPTIYPALRGAAVRWMRTVDHIPN